MTSEIKIRLHDWTDADNKLRAAGAEFIGQTQLTDTYFRQEPGNVLKLTITNENARITKLQAQNGGFEIVSDQRINNPAEARAMLADQFGEISTQEKDVREYAFGENKASIILIKNVGDFLVLEGASPTKELIEKKLGFQKPEYITVPFYQVKSLKGTE